MRKYFVSLVLTLSLLMVPYAAIHAAAADSTGDNCNIGVSSQFASAFGVHLCYANDVFFAIAKILLSVLAMIAVLFIIIGGFQYVTSSGNQEQAEKGRSTVVYAVIGLVIAILAYTIVSVVNNSVKDLGSSAGTSGTTNASQQPQSSAQAPSKADATARLTNAMQVSLDSKTGNNGVYSYTFSVSGTLADLAAAGGCLSGASSTSFQASAGLDITHNFSVPLPGQPTSDHVDFNLTNVNLNNNSFSVTIHGTSAYLPVLPGENDSAAHIFGQILGNAGDCNVYLNKDTTGTALGG
ncbi:hypothetical protein KGQ24_03010 [Patescibacteria group bacterium]|nr:hypothetical protein [Patescibacteria group bacterium]